MFSFAGRHTASGHIAGAAELEGEGGLEGGFTLIELMVVLLIIAILLAIAIPTFLGVTGSANDRSAQSTMTNAVTEAVAIYQTSQTFPDPATITNYTTPAPEYGWTTGSCSSSSSNCVSVAFTDALSSSLTATNDYQGVVLAVMSKTGTCWWATNLQANPVAPTGTDTHSFIQGAVGAAGSQDYLVAGTNTLIATAGTYYAKKLNATTCQASTALAHASPGFNWGTSYSNAGVN